MSPGAAMSRADAPESPQSASAQNVCVREQRSRGSTRNPRPDDGLGSERGLATPSPDGKGESLNPVTVDHAAGFLRHARTQLRTY
jgi:hypothetical protein